MHARGDMDRVRQLIEEGLADHEVSALSRVPIGTVRRWRHGATLAFGPRAAARPRTWRPADPWSYAHLLGLYLGDGCVSRTKSALLQIALDARYPGLIDECVVSMCLTMPASLPRVYPSRVSNAVCVQSSDRRWLEAFPQHGPGR